MSKIPSPSPAAFDGHWLTPAQMAALAGTSTRYLALQHRVGKFPPGSVIVTLGGQRRYDAGKISQRGRTDERADRRSDQHCLPRA